MPLPHPYTRKDAEAWVALQSSKDPAEYFAICDAAGPIGGIGLNTQRGDSRRSAELGYYLGKQFWGRGITTAAVKVVTTYGFVTRDDPLGISYCGPTSSDPRAPYPEPAGAVLAISRSTTLSWRCAGVIGHKQTDALKTLAGGSSGSRSRPSPLCRPFTREVSATEKLRPRRTHRKWPPTYSFLTGNRACARFRLCKNAQSHDMMRSI